MKSRNLKVANRRDGARPISTIFSFQLSVLSSPLSSLLSPLSSLLSQRIPNMLVGVVVAAEQFEEALFRLFGHLDGVFFLAHGQLFAP